MHSILYATALLAVGLANVEGERGLLVASDPQEATTARLLETDDAVVFEITSPPYLFPSIAIDWARNGKVDADEDFMVSLQEDGTPCFSELLGERESTTCQPFGEKARVTRQRDGETLLTSFSFPKRSISGDSFGFGFAIKLWNMKERYGASLGGGDYRFGGFLELVRDGQNFLGEGLPVPSEVLSALRPYQSCLNRGIEALTPLDDSKLVRLKAVPSGCVSDRKVALKEAVKALVASGAQASEAERATQSLLDQMDTGINRFILVLEAGPPKN